MARTALFSVFLTGICYIQTYALLEECSTTTCTYNGHVYCGHIPCPLPLCDQPLVLTPGDCCEHCPTSTRAQTPDCPHPCWQGGVRYCHPIPCPLPPCVDSETKTGVCCPDCPNGPNCQGPDGHVIAYHDWKIIDGKNCTCELPRTDAKCV